MAVHEAESLCHQLMSQYGLTAQGWTFKWNNRAMALGVCNYTDRQINMSKPLVVVGVCPSCSKEYGQQRMPRDKTKWGCPDCKFDHNCDKRPWEDRQLQWERVSDRMNKKVDDAVFNSGIFSSPGPNSIGR
jgi:hypothetical protein